MAHFARPTSQNTLCLAISASPMVAMIIKHFRIILLLLFEELKWENNFFYYFSLYGQKLLLDRRIIKSLGYQEVGIIRPSGQLKLGGVRRWKLFFLENIKNYKNLLN